MNKNANSPAEDFKNPPDSIKKDIYDSGRDTYYIDINVFSRGDLKNL